MAEGDPIKSRFPGQHALIGDKRRHDSALEEICSDLELLDQLLVGNAGTLSPGTRQDILESIRALEAEIAGALATTDPIKKD